MMRRFKALPANIRKDFALTIQRNFNFRGGLRSVPAFEHEEDGEEDEGEGEEVIPFQGLFQVGDWKHGEHDKSHHFLRHFELGYREIGIVGYFRRG